MPDLFQQLKQKYQSVLDTIQSEGAELHNLNLDGDQLYLKATAKSETSKNRIWDAIKKVDPNYAESRRSEQDQTRARVTDSRGLMLEGAEDICRNVPSIQGNFGGCLRSTIDPVPIAFWLVKNVLTVVC